MVSHPTEQQINQIVSYLDDFEKDDFDADPQVQGVDIIYNSSVEPFLRDLYATELLISFNWTAWTDQANQYIDNPDLLDSADLETLRKLLTAHARQERFCAGHVGAMLRIGHIQRILRRLKQLA